MQNKGFVRFIAIALILACAYYLSFSFVTSHFESKAEELAAGDIQKYNSYLDSLSSEKVYLGFTLKECREQEINLGLDLKGGMNVILEVSVPDLVRTLSGNNTSENFNKAIEVATARQQSSQSDFLTLFEQAYLEIDPNVRLSAVFSTIDLKNKISLNSTNAEVMNVLRDEIDASVSNSFNILRTRIDRFGVVQPNIQRLENSGRILVELPGIKEPERVRKLLQGTANLEFWGTYELSELVENFVNVNAALKELQVGSAAATATTDTIIAPTEKTESSAKDSLLAKINKDEAVAETEKSKEELEKENPLFSILQLNVTPSGQAAPGSVVGMAHYADTAKIRSYFEMKQIKQLLPSDLSLKWGVKAIDDKGQYFELYAIKSNVRDGKAPLEGDVITDASSDFGQYSSFATVNMQMNPDGANVWARMTEDNIGRCIAIVLDGYVYSAPRVNDKITGGRSEISGNFTVEEAKDLANVLKSGKMPAPVVIVQEDVVGPSLGQEAIENGLISFIIAFILVLVYMVLYYGTTAGLVADTALIVNVFLLFGVLASFKAVLTLSGLTGIVLTMGMAVDTNVLIYDRIREELRGGKTLEKAISEGYSNASSAIIDANLTTIITGIILFFFGTGPIKGFATTLIIGIITSLLTGFVLSKMIYEYLIKKNKIREGLSFSTNFSKNMFQNMNFDFLGSRKVGYILSGSLILIACISFATRGLNLGIDFSGGRNYVVRFDKAVSTQEVRDILSDAFDGQTPSVITIKSSEIDNSDSRVRISTNFRVDETSVEADQDIENRLYESLKPLMKKGVTKEEFAHDYILNSQKVGPTIADDIKRDAVIAITLAILAIALYIFIRFRNLAFSVGSIVSLVHDTVIIIGCYSLFYSIMPFSMEIDQAFIAAILTVVGYSINDTVVVFDRVREYHTIYPNREKKLTINNALNSTLSRTFNTSFTTAIVLIAIFIFGGESIRGFVFSILIGVVIGTYSTLFIAVPTAFDFLNKKDKKEKA